MKIKVGDKIYSGEDQAIMVILEPQDKINISRMGLDMKHYCVYPSIMHHEVIKEWMEDDVAVSSETF